MKQYFILGTDTGCGKTFVTCKLMQTYRSMQQRVLAVKPVASGGVEERGEWINEDVKQLRQHNECADIEINPWCLRQPVSPHLAAKHDGRLITAKKIVDYCQSLTRHPYDVCLIEGAGGLMVPLNDDETWVDVLILSRIPVILVVGMRLGCLNHALLTRFALKAHHIECAGWVANCLDPEMLLLEENIKTLTQALDIPLLHVETYDDRLKC